jgi:hypothetical protein
MLHRELKVKEQKVKAKATERRVKERRAKAKAREHVGKEAKAKASYKIVTTTITHYQFHSIKGPGAHEKKTKNSCQAQEGQAFDEREGPQVEGCRENQARAEVQGKEGKTRETHNNPCAEALSTQNQREWLQNKGENPQREDCVQAPSHSRKAA